MIERTISAQLENAAKWLPVVTLTGPRQSGKSTLVKATFPDYDYVNLENPETGRAAREDPVGFIRHRKGPLIIDEAQNAPELFSMVQVAADETSAPGQFVITGSQNFSLLKSIKQSLAGRTAILKLLPLSFAEVSTPLDDFIVTGGYPRVYDTGMPRDMFMSGYIETYIERDAAGLLDVRNLSSFRDLLKLCAASVGSQVNYARFASDLGVNAATVKSWLSILQSSYIVYLLPAYSRNLRKRVAKKPKLYFCDTGLLCNLLSVDSIDEARGCGLYGEIVECAVVSEMLKRHLNSGRVPELYYYRDDSKREIDLIDLTEKGSPRAMEIKGGETYRSGFARHLNAICPEIGIPESGRIVAYRGEGGYSTEGVRVVGLEDLFAERDRRDGTAM